METMEFIIINQFLDGLYTFQCNSDLDSYGYLYLNCFNSFNSSDNLLIENDDSEQNYNFQIIYQLHLSINIF